MNKSINAIKQGNVVNISIAGKLHKKNCGSVNEANELFRIALAAKSNPSDENIKALKSYLNEKLRIAYLTGLETDVESGEVFMAGFNTPVPKTLIDIIEEYHNNKFPLQPIFNFWKLLMINTDTRVRESLFKFITKHDFVLTDKGYMVTYKAVLFKNGDKPKTNALDAFVGEQYLFVKSKWLTSPKRYVVYKNLEDNSLNITKLSTAEKWDAKVKNLEILGNLQDIYNAVVKNKVDVVEENKTIYTDMHTREMSIELGVPVVKDRKDCDADPARDCSYGLHVGATKYVENFATHGSNGAILVCLVNPANVVAVPDYDHSKMRVSEYFPIGLAKFENRKIDIIEQKYFEEDYCNYEVDELQKLIEKVKAGEKPLEIAKNSQEETRPLSELQKIIESRLVDIS